MATLDDYVATIKATILSLGKKAVVSALIAELPFLGLPVIRHIVEFVVGIVLEFFINKAETGAFFIYIDLRTSAQGRAFEDAAIANERIQANGTSAERAAAEQKLIDTFRQLAKFNS